MPQSYFLTENGLKIRNCLNPECCEYVQFHSVNPVAQALRDFIVSGPELIPGITAAALVMQARTYANTPVPEAFYYTLQESVLALKAARPYSLPLARTVAMLSRQISELVSSRVSVPECIRALEHFHGVLCDEIDRVELLIRKHLEKLVPREGTIVSCGGMGSVYSVSSGTLVPMLAGRRTTGAKVPHVLSPVGSPLTENVFTVKELTAAGCTAELVSDAGLASVMLRHPVKAVFVQAGRICANGDVLAAAGATGPVALAKTIGIPVYVVAYPYVFDSTYAAAAEVPPEDEPALPASDENSIVPLEPRGNLIPRDWVTAYVTTGGPVASSDSLKLYSDTADALLVSGLQSPESGL